MFLCRFIVERGITRGLTDGEAPGISEQRYKLEIGLFCLFCPRECHRDPRKDVGSSHTQTGAAKWTNLKEEEEDWAHEGGDI